MKYITKDFLTAFINSQKIPYAATQSKLCVPIISRMCNKMEHGIKFDDIKVVNNLIINGHHRFLSALIMDFKIGEVPGNITSATIKISWNDVELDDADWDTIEKINECNLLDAKYNDIEISELNKILNSDR